VYYSGLGLVGLQCSISYHTTDGAMQYLCDVYVMHNILSFLSLTRPMDVVCYNVYHRYIKLIGTMDQGRMVGIDLSISKSSCYQLVFGVTDEPMATI
jgi:hypothetical protein